MNSYHIRVATPRDAEALLDHVDRLTSEPDVDVPLLPGELGMSVEQERDFLAEMQAAENSVFLLALSEARLVGELSVRGGQIPATRHAGKLGMSVARAERGKGIGRALLEQGLDWARESGLGRIELEVYERNTPARRLYDRAGFLPEAHLQGAVCQGSEDLDVVLMGLLLDEHIAERTAPVETPQPRAVHAADASRSVVVREARPADAEALTAFFTAHWSNPDLFIPMAGHPEHANRERLHKRIEDYACQDNSVYLVAEAEDELIGSLSSQGGTRQRLRHAATFGMAVREAWRGRGVGSRLLEAFVDWAADNPRIRRVDLGVYAANHAARGLYEKFGFEREGLRRAAFFQRGRYYDDLILARHF